MSESRPHRIFGHLRRHAIAYAALALALSFSPVPSMAADLVTTRDIANGAVTTPKLAADSVVSGKIVDETVSGADIRKGAVGNAHLADSARGAKVIRYNLGSFDFTGDGSYSAQLFGKWNADIVAGSTWSATMHNPIHGDVNYVIPGHGHLAASDYRLLIFNDGEVVIDTASGPGEAYTNIRLYRIMATSTQAASPSPVSRTTRPE